MSAQTITVFAETNFRNQRRKFGVKQDDRRRHMYVVGKTGMGKSTLLENMVIADIRAGRGVAVVDPHGDLAEKILDFIPNNRVNDVIYFNPSDTKFPIAFNILESIGDDYKHLVAYGLVGVFKKIWADSWGPRMEYIMTNTILALLEYPGSTLLGLMRMLVDKAYRKKVVAKVTDPVVKTFWADEYANYSEKFRTEAIAPIQNKVGQFLASAIIRNIVGQSKSTIEMREIMDNQKILIMNLAKGRIGEENSALLGAMMITKLQIAAMSRVDIPEEKRVDFYLYVDEFQNFATDSFAGILSEARKYRLCLIMAHQYFEQLGDVVKAAVFGNVGTMIVFRVGATDAAELELEFAPQFLPTDIVNLKKYTFCLRLMVDGVATEPFSAIGLPPATGATTNHEKVLKVSRERYARPQELVEDRIIRWSGVEINRPNQPAADGSQAVVVDEDSEGDNMDWPDQVVSKSEPNTFNDESDTAAAKSGGVQLATAETLQPSAYVSAAGFIPGDHAPTPSIPVQVKPAVVEEAAEGPKPTVESLSQPSVVLEPEAETVVPAVTTRPRISFVHHGVPGVTGIAESASPEASQDFNTIDVEGEAGIEVNQAECIEEEGEEHE
ncbi:MAG: type IV secretion system DNA-binding domain-containing protein [Candidatus Kerfeldbacteria bacterium]|nr:type IV secretion system DNA-binding domain-containing protein [Candidatus Kerfeldbacteria bacterium]